MVKKRQLFRVSRESLGDIDDLFVHEDLAMMLPTHHIARLIQFETCSDPDTFLISWHHGPLFTLGTGLPYYSGQRIAHPGGQGWSLDMPDLTDRIRQEVEAKVIGTLREGGSLDTLEAFMRRHSAPIELGPWFEAIIAIAMGDLDRAAEKVMSGGSMAWGPDRLNCFVRGLGDRLRDKGAALGSDDRRLLAKTLHFWERRSVAVSRLGKAWVSTPFPLEETF